MPPEVPGPGSLERFVAAQAPVIAAVEAELAAGRKRTHWMWFVFPQLRGLGMSATARFYGLADLAEAGAFLAHPVLGPRLIRCTTLALGVPGRTAHEIFGDPDEMKFRSCMTLFARLGTGPGEGAPRDVFGAALDRFFGGEPDRRTLAMLD